MIVGGGMAGLHLASLLAKDKPAASIAIIEKYDYWGGRVYTFVPRLNPKVHYESGAGRIADEHKRVGKYVKKYDLAKFYITGKPVHRQIDLDGKVNLDQNGFAEIIYRMLLSLPPIIKKSLHTMTVREACERAYGKDIVDRVFIEFGYRSETETLRADVALKKFTSDAGGFMGENENYYVLADGFSEITRRLSNEVLEMGVHLVNEIEVEDAIYQKDNKVWTLKGSCKGTAWSGKAKHVILALHRNALDKFPLFKNTWITRSVQMNPLCRIYATFPKGKDGKVWFHDIPHTTTNDSLRYIIPVNKEKGIIMISYTDAQDTQVWTAIKEKEVREEKIMEHVRLLFPEKVIPKPLAWSYHPWYDGCSYWLPYPRGPTDVEAITKRILYPFPDKAPNLYLCGESWSHTNQAWVEGALETAEDLFTLLKN
jgi:hypothetical protein